MTSGWECLQTAFVDENRRLIEALQDVIDALEGDAVEEAAVTARALDRQFGPFIEFQHRYLYPHIELCEGEAWATQLYDADARLIAALGQLQHLDGAARDRSDALRLCLSCVRQGLCHAGQADQRLAYLKTLGGGRHRYLVQRWDRLRRTGHCWSQLHPHRDP